jgi:hypothetical protein
MAKSHLTKAVLKANSTISELVVNSKVLIVDTPNVGHKYPQYIGQIGTITKVPVHPITWFKIKFDDGNIVTFRPSALRSINSSTGKVKPHNGSIASISHTRRSRINDDEVDVEDEDECDIEDVVSRSKKQIKSGANGYATRLGSSSTASVSENLTGDNCNSATSAVPLSSMAPEHWFNALVRFQKYSNIENLNTNSSSSFSDPATEYQYGNVSGGDHGWVYITSSDTGEVVRRLPHEVCMIICSSEDFDSSATISAIAPNGYAETGNTSGPRSNKESNASAGSKASSPRGRPRAFSNGNNASGNGCNGNGNNGNGHKNSICQPKRLETSSYHQIEAVAPSLNQYGNGEFAETNESVKRYPLLSSEIINRKAEKIKKCIKEQKKYQGRNRIDLESTRRVVRGSFIETEDDKYMNEDLLNYESETRNDFERLSRLGAASSMLMENFLVAVDPCPCCKLELWPGSNFCWNQNCSISPICSDNNHNLGRDAFDNDTLMVSTSNCKGGNEMNEMRFNETTSFLLLQPHRIDRVLCTASMGGPSNYLSSMLDLEASKDEDCDFPPGQAGSSNVGVTYYNNGNMGSPPTNVDLSNTMHKPSSLTGLYDNLPHHNTDRIDNFAARIAGNQPVAGMTLKIPSEQSAYRNTRDDHAATIGDTTNSMKTQSQLEEPSSKGSINSTASSYSNSSIPTLLMSLYNSVSVPTESSSNNASPNAHK